MLVKKFLKSSIFILVLSLLSVGGAILIHSVLAFTGPTDDPPVGNIVALVEDDTLDNVADRGATTNQTLTVAGINLNGSALEGDAGYIDEIIGYNDLFIKGNSVETAVIYYGASEHKFYTGGTEKFAISNDGTVTLEGELVLNNTATKGSCAAGNKGAMVFDTAEDKPYVCTASGWKPLDSDYDKDGLTDWKDLNDNDSTPQNSIANLSADNIKSGVNIFGVDGSYGGGDPCDGSPTPGQGCTDGSIYVGDTPDGGVKMYLTSSAYDTQAQWGPTHYPFAWAGASSATDGDGNTAAIVAYYPPYSSTAAEYCNNLIAHGRNDWYLPARNELAILYNSARPIGQLLITTTYWTSTENSTFQTDAYYYYPNLGTSNYSSKTTATIYVKCARHD